MTTTDADKPFAAIDASNVIPFPDSRASAQQPAAVRTGSSGFSLPLRQAVGTAKAALLRFIRTANRAAVQVRSGSTAASAAHRLRRQQAPAQDHRGIAIRKRMSA